MNTRKGRSLTLGIVALLALMPVTHAQEEPVPQAKVDVARRTVTVPATLELKNFAGASLKNHHLLTWSGGRAGKNALLRTPVSDTHILDALEAVGGKPGDNLSDEAWSKRDDPKNPAPDTVAKGTKIELTLILPDGSRRPLTDLLEDVDKRGYAWVLAGNRKLIPVWKSGCVVCLQSCPGSKVANAKATIRHLHQGKSRFRASALAKKLGEGAKVHVELKVVLPAEKKAAKKAREAD
jgi:hypothetical protein